MQYENEPTKEHLNKINEWNQLLDQVNDLLGTTIEDCFADPLGKYHGD